MIGTWKRCTKADSRCARCNADIPIGASYYHAAPYKGLCANCGEPDAPRGHGEGPEPQPQRGNPADLVVAIREQAAAARELAAAMAAHTAALISHTAAVTMAREVRLAALAETPSPTRTRKAKGD